MFIFWFCAKVVSLKFVDPHISHHHHHHHHNESNQGLGLKTCSFKAQCVLGLSIFVLVFPYPVIPEVGTAKPALVGGFYPLVPGGLTIS
jgi:hypothetical protein